MGIEAQGCARAIVALGDPITDGRRSTTNGDDRRADRPATRLQAGPKMRDIAVISQGSGGDRVPRDGIDPSALARLDRDVRAQPGVRWLILSEGIDGIGTRKRHGIVHADLVAQVTAGHAQIATRAHARGIKVIGATLLPHMATSAHQSDPADERDRQAINARRRAPGHIDAVVDLDRVTRDPANPQQLSPACDMGDRLHSDAAGCRAIGGAFPLDLFAR